MSHVLAAAQNVFALARASRESSSSQNSPAWDGGVPESWGTRGGEWLEKSNFVRKLLNTFHVTACIVFWGSCNGNIFRKGQSSRISGISFDREIAAEAKDAYFCQMQFYALLGASDSTILGAAYEQRHLLLS